MDIQSIARLMKTFPVMAQPGIDTSRLIDNTSPDDTNTELLNSYQPRTAISDQLTSTLGNMPERPVPSRLRHIGAAIAGLGAGASPIGIAGGQPIGFKYNPLAADAARDKVNYGDFDNAMTDFQNKVKSLALGANEEDRANAGEVKRIAGDEQRNINQQKADILQQQADTATEKNRNIYEVKKQENIRKVAEADSKLTLAKQKLDQNQENIDNLKEYHKAQLASIDARRRAQTDDDAFKLEETKRIHDAQIKRMEALNNKSDVKERESTTELIDANGNVTTDSAKAVRKVTRSGVPKGTKILTSPDGKHYDTSTWSEEDIQAAKAKGYR